MKFVLSFMLAMSMFMLMSCSDKPASSKLSVSFGFTAPASLSKSYEGGIVFYGRSSTNKVFSAPLLGQNNQVQIDLDKGVWTLGAVGWHDPSILNGATTILNGSTECALLKNVTIDTDEKTLVLNLDSATCADSEFGASSFWQGSSINKFKGLGLITCGTFYKDSSYDSLQNDEPSYCNSASQVDADFKTHAKSALVEIPSLTPGLPKGSSALSVCIDLNDGQHSSGVYNIPSKGLPINIQLFDNGCSEVKKKPMAKYLFNRGLDFNYSSQFDYKHSNKLNNPSTTLFNLYLLATDSRRQETFFLNSLPKLKCHTESGYSCNTIPTILIPAGVENDNYRIVEPTQEFFVRDAVSADSCTGATLILGIGSESQLTQCSIRKGKIFAGLQEDQLTNCGSGCEIKFRFNSTTDAFMLNLTKSSTNEISALNFLYKIVGYEELPSSNQDTKNSLSSLFEDESYGVLSEVRKLMAPGFIGGVLNPVKINGVESFNIYKWEGISLKTYQLEAKETTAPVPAFIFDDPNNTDDTFDYQITISKPRTPPLSPQPFIELKFQKDKKIGMMEQLTQKVDNNRLVIDRSLTYWNTEGENLNRTESYTFRQESINGTIKYRNVSYSRAQRDNVAADIDPSSITLIDGFMNTGSGLRVEEYQFSSHGNCPPNQESCSSYSSYSEKGSKQLLFLNGNMAKFTKQVYAKDNYSNPLGFFLDASYDSFRESEVFDSTVIPTCFNRSIDPQNPVGLNSVVDCTGFSEPEPTGTNLPPPIHQLKFNNKIDDLKPTNFLSIFSLGLN